MAAADQCCSQEHVPAMLIMPCLIQHELGFSNQKKSKTGAAESGCTC